MIEVKCVDKLKDKSGNITKYKLVDKQGQVKVFTATELKQAMKMGNLTVVNLTLTKDNRLVSKGVQPDKPVEMRTYIVKASGDEMPVEFYKITAPSTDSYDTVMQNFTNASKYATPGFDYDDDSANGLVQYLKQNDTHFDEMAKAEVMQLDAFMYYMDLIGYTVTDITYDFEFEY